jgi:glycosyltransferase involved in cell wall biosynthesis
MTKRVRILHLRPSGFVGGPERQILRYAQVDQFGATTTVVGTFVGEHEGRALVEAARDRGLETLLLPAGAFGDCTALPGLVRALREREISLICAHGYQSDIMGIIAGLAGRVPVACFLRGWTWEDWKVRAYEAMDRTSLHFARCVVCLSETQAARLRRRRSLRNKVRVVLNVVEERSITSEQRLRVRQEVRRRFGFSDDARVVAMAGRLSPEKGTEYFLRAAQQLPGQTPFARFVVFGDGRLRRHLEETTNRLGVAGRVTFAGHVSEFPHLLPGIDVLVNCSLTEEMPNVVLEAMAAAVPVVATDVGSVKEIDGEETALMIVPPGDPVSIAREVADLLRDPERAGALGLMGQKRIGKAFSPMRQCEQLLEMYREMIPGLPPVDANMGLGSGTAPACGVDA